MKNFESKFQKVNLALLLILTAVMIALCCSGCKTIKSSTHTSETSTVKIHDRDTTVYYKGGKVQALADLDSIINVLRAQMAVKGRLNGANPMVTYKDSSGKVILSFFVDELGRIKATCESLDAEHKIRIRDMQTEHTKQMAELKEVYINQIPRWCLKLMWGLSIALLICIGIIIYLVKFK